MTEELKTLSASARSSSRQPLASGRELTTNATSVIEVKPSAADDDDATIGDDGKSLLLDLEEQSRQAVMPYESHRRLVLLTHLENVFCYTFSDSFSPAK